MFSHLPLPLLYACWSELQTHLPFFSVESDEQHIDPPQFWPDGQTDTHVDPLALVPGGQAHLPSVSTCPFGQHRVFWPTQSLPVASAQQIPFEVYFEQVRIGVQVLWRLHPVRAQHLPFSYDCPRGQQPPLDEHVWDWHDVDPHVPSCFFASEPQSYPPL
jgi:hypothetical protein